MFVLPPHAPPIEDSNFLLIYEADPRPTFCIDLATAPRIDSLQPVYANQAFSVRQDLCAKINDISLEGSEFRTWALSAVLPSIDCPFDSTVWFGLTVHNRWRIISTCPYGFVLSRLGRPSMLSIKPSAVETTTKDEISRSNGLSPEAGSANGHNLHLNFVKQLQSVLHLQTKTQRQHVSEYPDATPSSIPLSQVDQEICDLVALEKEIVLAESEAKQDQVMLAEQLARRTVEARNVSVALNRFQSLAQMIDIGFFDYSPDGKLVFANDAWYAMSGHPRDPRLHTEHAFINCVHPDDAEFVMQQWYKVVQGQPLSFEMRWQHSLPPGMPPGTEPRIVWVNCAWVPIFAANGNIDGVSGCLTDINAQKKSADVAFQRAEALERAKMSEARFMHFAEVSSIALFTFNSTEKLDYCNARWFEMMGMDVMPVLEVDWTQGFVDADLPAAKEAWETAIKSRRLATIEVRLKKPWYGADGRKAQTYVMASFFAEFTDNQEYKGCTASLTDISQMKWVEQLQQTRMQEALDAKRQQENFIDMTSHEMRNPLSAMVQCADTVLAAFSDLSQQTITTLDNCDPDLARAARESVDMGMDAVQTILACAAHQKRIVDDILTLSKLDSNLLTIAAVRTQPIAMIHEAMKMFEIEAQKASITLGLEVHPSFQELEIDWLMLDPSRTLQVLINLMTNAIKFTRGEAIRTIALSLAASLSPYDLGGGIEYIPARTKPEPFSYGPEWGDGEFIYLHVSLTDTGRGLAEDEKARLWRRFSQASPKTHVKYGGSGLGLFISRQLCELQGGEIGMASEANKGSTFSFYIKTRRTTQPTMRTLANDTLSNGNDILINAKDDRPLVVLVVEDNLVNQKVLVQQLMRLGCSVFTAGHGLEALEFLKSTSAWTGSSALNTHIRTRTLVTLDTILMDTEMPVMGGLECTREIRALEFRGQLNTHIPIISISANARAEQVSQALAAGVDDTITKPFRMMELLPKIQKLAGRAPG